MQVQHLLRAGRWGALLLGTLLPLPAVGGEREGEVFDPVAAALTLAHRATSRTEIDAAASALFALLPSYPQDVDIPLQLAWLRFRTSRYPESLSAYQLALSRSTPGGEAELGLGWALVKLGRCTEARGHFHAVLTVNPAQSTAADGLRQCAAPAATVAKIPKLWLAPFVAQSMYLYQNHPFISYAAAPTARLELLLRGRFYGAVTYRYSHFATYDGQTAAWNQHDLYVDAGVTGKSAGVTLRYAFIADGSGYSGNTHHAGLSARYSRGFDSLLNLSASFYQDAPVLRGELAWVLPIVGGFSVRPGGAVQWTPTATFQTMSLTLSYFHRFFAIWLGGKYGDEKRAAYLTVAYVYNSPATIPYGFWAGATIHPGQKVALTLGYTYDRLVRSDTTPVQNSLVHSLTLGVTREF